MDWLKKWEWVGSVKLWEIFKSLLCWKVTFSTNRFYEMPRTSHFCGVPTKSWKCHTPRGTHESVSFVAFSWLSFKKRLVVVLWSPCPYTPTDPCLVEKTIPRTSWHSKKLREGSWQRWLPTSWVTSLKSTFYKKVLYASTWRKLLHKIDLFELRTLWRLRPICSTIDLGEAKEVAYLLVRIGIM